MWRRLRGNDTSWYIVLLGLIGLALTVAQPLRFPHWVESTLLVILLVVLAPALFFSFDAHVLVPLAALLRALWRLRTHPIRCLLSLLVIVAWLVALYALVRSSQLGASVLVVALTLVILDRAHTGHFDWLVAWTREAARRWGGRRD